MSHNRPALLLFDIDGTLVLTGRAGMRAMTQTFEDVFGVADAFGDFSFGGRTDSFLVSHALARASLPDTPDQHARFQQCYVLRLAEEIHHQGTGFKGVMPGVRELLDALRPHRHLHVALLTGNYRNAAEVKLRHFALWDYFPWGAFSDDASDRNALVPIARTRAAQYAVPEAACARVFVIGDTPHDVECAAVSGARSITVTTGGHDHETLRRAGADVVLDDLSDTEAVLNLLL